MADLVPEAQENSSIISILFSKLDRHKNPCSYLLHSDGTKSLYQNELVHVHYDFSDSFDITELVVFSGQSWSLLRRKLLNMKDLTRFRKSILC